MHTGKRQGRTNGRDADITIAAADLTGNGRDSGRVTAALRAAIEGPGYAIVENLFAASGGEPAVLASMRSFFSLPDDDAAKQRINVQHRPDTRGWMPLGGEPAYEAGTRARVESFDVGRPGDAANAWPDIPAFRERTEALWSDFSCAGLALMEAIAATCSLPRDAFRAHCNTQELSTMRLLHYPGQDVPPGDGDVGISAHTDFECMTLLFQTAPGLELQDREGRWCEAPAGGGRAILLFGDMLETWTNGRVRATPHRVRMTSYPRFSTVLFFAVNAGVTVAPLPAFAGAGDPSRYPALDQRSHSAERLRRAEANRDALAAGQGDDTGAAY